MSDVAFLRLADASWMVFGLAALLFWCWKRPRRSIGATTVAYLQAPGLRATSLRLAPAFLLMVALVATSAALLEPVLTSANMEVESVGVDIVLVLDLSSSMQEVMGLEQPSSSTSPTWYSRGKGRRNQRTRLDVTKEALKQVVRGRQGDRIGVVVFSDNAYIVSPLTFDYRYLLRYIDMVDEKILRDEGMTAIGEGLALAHYLLQRQGVPERRSRAIVIFTDGENNLGRDPVQTLREVIDDQVAVHLVGVDMGVEIKLRPQVQQLVQAVVGYGGSHFDADTAERLVEISEEIDELEKGSLTQVIAEENKPYYAIFVVIALVALVTGAAFGAIPRWVDLT